MLQRLVSAMQNENLTAGDDQHIGRYIAIQIAEYKCGGIALELETGDFGESFMRSFINSEFRTVLAVNPDHQLRVLPRPQLICSRRCDAARHIDGLQHFERAGIAARYHIETAPAARR